MKLIPHDQKLRFVVTFEERRPNGARVETLRCEEFGLTINRVESPRGAVDAALKVDGLPGEFKNVAAANEAIAAVIRVRSMRHLRAGHYNN